MANEQLPQGIPRAERLGLRDYLRSLGAAILRFAAGSTSPRAVEVLRRAEALDNFSAVGIQAAERFANSSRPDGS